MKPSNELLGTTPLMNDEQKSKAQLIQELTMLRQAVGQSASATAVAETEFRSEQLQYEAEQRKLAEQTLRQRNRELRLLIEVSQAFISTLDLDSVLAIVLEEVRQALDVVACSAWLIDNETNEVVCRQVTDPQSEIVRGWRVPMGKGFVGWVAEHGERLNVPDTRADHLHFKGVDKETGLVLRSILSVPLWVKENTIGVIQAVDAKVNRFTDDDLDLLESLAATAAIAIENVRLYEQARRDAETKTMLLNEVNHRVKNNLAAIIGLLYAERRHLDQETQTPYRMFMTDLIGHIHGLETVHNLLSASEWAPLPLSHLAHQIIHSTLQALPSSKRVSVTISQSAVEVTAKQANSLALVLNELTTNTIKYALEERDTGKIIVTIDQDNDMIIFKFQDDGPGYPATTLSEVNQNVGLYLIKNIVRKDLRGTVSLSNEPGAATTLRF